MLDYCKTVLSKISFYPSLFRKEYRKTFNYLDAAEQVELKKWLRENLSIRNPVTKIKFSDGR